VTPFQEFREAMVDLQRVLIDAVAGLPGVRHMLRLIGAPSTNEEGELWQQRKVREEGLCGDLVGDGSLVCIRSSGHDKAEHPAPSTNEGSEG